jgi:hypothetical protein
LANSDGRNNGFGRVGRPGSSTRNTGSNRAAGWAPENPLGGHLAGGAGGLFKSGEDLGRARPIAVYDAFQALQAEGAEHEQSGETHRDQPGHSREVNRHQVSSGSRNATVLSAVSTLAP